MINIPFNDKEVNYVDELTHMVLDGLMSSDSTYIGPEVFNTKYNDQIVTKVARVFVDKGYYAKICYRYSNNNVFSLHVSKTPLQQTRANAIYSVQIG